MRRKKDHLYWRRLLVMARYKTKSQEGDFSPDDLLSDESREQRAMEIVQMICPSLYEQGVNGYSYQSRWA